MNKKLFKSESNLPPVNTTNNAGGKAYSLDDQEALAQLVCTGTFNNTFYTKGEDQLKTIIELAKKVDSDYLTKLAIYARENAYMKDSPVVLLAVLSTICPTRFKVAAPRVLDNMKMIRNMITVIRSGVVGRKSLGSCIRKHIRRVIENYSLDALVNQSIGENPSLKDILCLVHARPKDPQKDAYFKSLFDKKYNKELLPESLKQLEAFKNGSGVLPVGIDWQYLTAYPLTPENWVQIGTKMNWHALRMNLNTLERNKVFEDKNAIKTIATKLRSEDDIKKIKLFPYQVYSTLLHVSGVPQVISNALQDALDISVSNLTAFKEIDKLFICVDCSSSMNSSITGNSAVPSKISCNQAASVLAAALAKSNQEIDTTVIRFDTEAHQAKLNLKDSMFTLASSIEANGGGTSMSSAMRWIKSNGSIKKSDRVGIVVISDNESWADISRTGPRYYDKHTLSSETLRDISKKSKSVKTVLIDIMPNTTTQVKDNKDVLNIGGFSDTVFTAITNFFENSDRKWTDHINSSVQLGVLTHS